MERATMISGGRYGTRGRSDELETELQVNKEDEAYLRGHWKLVATCQFFTLFRNILRLKDPVTPYDLEQSLLRPQHDQLCGDLISRLINKKYAKTAPQSFSSSNLSYLGGSNGQETNGLDYEEWNMNLAKKFHGMFKSYRKFAIRYLGFDPQSKIEGEQAENQQLSEQSEEQKKEDILSQDEQMARDLQKQEEVKERMTRGKAKKAVKSSQESIDELAAKLPQPQWSSDIKANLLKHGEKSMLIRFANENQLQLKTEVLQQAKFFCEDLEGADPFYIPGQDWSQIGVRDSESSNYVHNFIDTGNIEDFEDIQLLEVLPGKSQIEIQFKRFHEISIKNRLDVLYYLCQQKLDSETVEYMQEMQALSQTKPVKPDLSEGQQFRISDEVKQMLDPVYLGLLKPLAILPIDLAELLPSGHYFYFPFFQDTRIYRQSLDNETFELYADDLLSIYSLLETLQHSLAQEPQPSCHGSIKTFHEGLSRYVDLLKKYSDDMRWKEASKVRKLKSQIRSRKLNQDSRTKKMQYSSGRSQLQSDYLHGQKGKILTRKDIDRISGGNRREESKRGELQENERQRRLEKRGQSRDEIKKNRRRPDYDDYDDEEEGGDDEYGEQYATEQVGTRRSQRRGHSRNEDVEDEISEGRSGTNKRRRLEHQNEEEGSEELQYQEMGENENEVPEIQEIILEGHLLMIYKRDKDEPENISGINMALKGSWKMGQADSSEDFIYKRVGNPQQEDLLLKLFCQDPSEKVQAPDLSLVDSFNPQVQSQVLQRFNSSQGHYQGFFKYLGKETQESFSIILLKSRSASGYIKKNTYDVKGYGENEIGCFTLEGQITLPPFDRVQERPGIQNYQKVKMAKLELKKTYQLLVLEELVDQAQAEREKEEDLKKQRKAFLSSDFVPDLDEVIRMRQQEVSSSIQKQESDEIGIPILSKESQSFQFLDPRVQQQLRQSSPNASSGPFIQTVHPHVFHAPVVLNQSQMMEISHFSPQK